MTYIEPTIRAPKFQVNRDSSRLFRPVSLESHLQLMDSNFRPAFSTIATLDNETGWGATATAGGSGGTVTFDADGGPFGSGCHIWTSPSETDSSRKDFTPGAQFTTRGGIGVWVKDENNFSNPNIIQIYVAATGFGSYMNAGGKIAYNGYCGGDWKLLWIPADRFSVGAGAPTFEGTAWDILRVSVRCGSGGTNASVRIGPIVTLAAKTYNDPVVCFTMDDGNETDYSEVYAAFQDYGLKGSIFVIPSLVGSSGYLSEAQLKRMYADGWDICAHDGGNLSWTMDNGGETQSARRVYQRIKSVRDYLLDLGFERSAYYAAYPGGGFDRASLEAMEELGMFAAFRTGPAPTSPYTGSYAIMTAPQKPSDRARYEIGRLFLQNSESTTGADARAGLTAIINSKSIAVMGMHAVDAAGGHWASAQFDDFLTTASTGLAARVAAGEIQCKTLSEVF